VSGADAPGRFDVLALASSCPIVEVTDGHELFVAGEASGRLYVLVSGELEVRRHGRPLVRLSEPGSILGELGLLLQEPAVADVVAVGDVTAHRIDDAEDFFVRYPGFARHLATVLARRLREVSSYVADLQDQFADSSVTIGLIPHVVHGLVEEGGHAYDTGSDREPDSPY